MSCFTLRADKREIRSGIIADINKLRSEDSIVPASKYEFIEEVLTVGDYVIDCGNYVLIIERKSIADLAASIMDRRIYENHPKLTEAKQTAIDCGQKCQVMYLIEGRQFRPDGPKERYAGLLTSSLRAKIDHLQMEDGCLIEWTSNQKHTAMRLLELGKNMMTIKGNKHVDGASDKKVNVDAIVKKKFEKTVPEVQYEMLCCISGIGPKTAESLLEQVSFGSIMNNPDLEFESIPKKAESELNELHAGNRIAIARTMLTKIKGISIGLATTIVNSYSLSVLSSPEIDAKELADLKRENKKRLGNVLADRLIEHFLIPATEESV